MRNEVAVICLFSGCLVERIERAIPCSAYGARGKNAIASYETDTAAVVLAAG
jgi:hypothetical protein